MELQFLLSCFVVYFNCKERGVATSWECKDLGRIQIFDFGVRYSAIDIKFACSKIQETPPTMTLYISKYYNRIAKIVPCSIWGNNILRGKAVACRRTGRFLTFISSSPWTMIRRSLGPRCKLCLYGYRIKPKLGQSSLKFPNIALGKQVVGSSAYKPEVWMPNNMVDGREDISERGCTWAAILFKDPHPWWLIDLKIKSKVYGLRLIHLTTYGKPHDILIEVFANTPRYNQRGIFCIRLRTDLLYKMDIDCVQPRYGRYIKLSKLMKDDNVDVLAFCEIFVFGTVVPKGAENNYIKNSITTTESTYYVNPPTTKIQSLSSTTVYSPSTWKPATISTDGLYREIFSCLKQFKNHTVVRQKRRKAICICKCLLPLPTASSNVQKMIQKIIKSCY